MNALMSPPEPQVQAAPLLRAEFPVAFGRFLLLKRLSRGGMGEIFLAKIGEIAGFEKFVIIKKILPQLAANDDFIVRFIDEAQVAIKLNHVNIAQVYEVGRVDGEYFLAIEYIEGRDLRRLLRRCREMQRRLPVDLCLFIAREMASGLAYAHRRTGPKGQALALVHCDISPPNIMTSYEGEVKVIDFGIARSALRTADSNPNVGFGKFGYMAPEQLLRGGLIDRRTDIYAAGVVLYELLTGERLYQFPEGTDYRQMARVVCQGQFQLPSARDPAIDSDIDAIVSKALATRPEDRYQIAEEFRDALAAKLAHLAPTISADTLAATMDDLFVGERQREQDELLQLRAVDTSAYKEEMVGSVGHTVTFARAAEDAISSGRMASSPAASGAVSAVAQSGAMPATSGALPMGARLRLKASVNGVDPVTRTADPQMRKIFRAMQRHGLVVADNGTGWYISGATDARWDDLEEFYRTRGKLDEYVRVLEREVEARSSELSSAYAELKQKEARLRDLSSRAVVLEEDERRAIARELHDSAGQALTAIRIHLQLIGERVKESEPMRELVKKTLAMNSLTAKSNTGLA